MINKNEEQMKSKKVINIKEYLKIFIKWLVFAAIITILPNLINRVKILDKTEILAIILCSFIITTIGWFVKSK